MSPLNFISLLGIFGLCAIAWLFSENRNPKYFPWRVVIMGILLQLVLGALVFTVPVTRYLLEGFSNLLNVVFDAADAGARFIFGRNLVPLPGQEPLILSPLGSGGACAPGTAGQVVAGFCGIQLGYVFAFRALPAVIFFSGLMSLLYSLGVIQVITNIFAKVFYATMRLSGAEALSGAANIFVGIEAAIVVRQYLAKMTRSELCAILACCFGTAASSTLAIYVNFLRPVFPNILGHLVSASILAIPACFVLSKILVPETSRPLTAGGIPDERTLRAEPACESDGCRDRRSLGWREDVSGDRRSPDSSTGIGLSSQSVFWRVNAFA
jgi:concentrative nucleoside transporter, CNT family